MPIRNNPSAAEHPRIARGTPAFWHANIALFLGAMSVFALLYSVQPLLPHFSDEFALSAGASSLSLSVTTAALAVALLLASWIADSFGRKILMTASLVVAAALGLATAVAPDWSLVIASRLLTGFALGGVPAVAMTYLSEEMEPDALGFSMGLYIGGNAVGGMAGRLFVGILADYTSWRFALIALSALVIASAISFWLLLPAPRHSVTNRFGPKEFARLVAAQFRDAALPWLFVEAFLLMGAFVTLYNYTGFRLLQAPYGLSHTAISAIFVIYLIGTASSTWIGALAGSLGRRKVLWLMAVLLGLGVAVTCLSPLPWIIIGLSIATFGFFGAHSVASSWVGRRARVGRAQAAALYLLGYYLGSSIIGTLGGFAWNAYGWSGVAAVSGASALGALAVALHLSRILPLPRPAAG
jgi:YNFM family putative membrane transporter